MNSSSVIHLRPPELWAWEIAARDVGGGEPPVVLVWVLLGLWEGGVGLRRGEVPQGRVVEVATAVVAVMVVVGLVSGEDTIMPRAPCPDEGVQSPLGRPEVSRVPVDVGSVRGVPVGTWTSEQLLDLVGSRAASKGLVAAIWGLTGATMALVGATMVLAGATVVLVAPTMVLVPALTLLVPHTPLATDAALCWPGGAWHCPWCTGLLQGPMAADGPRRVFPSLKKQREKIR